MPPISRPLSLTRIVSLSGLGLCPSLQSLYLHLSPAHTQTFDEDAHVASGDSGKENLRLPADTSCLSTTHFTNSPARIKRFQRQLR
jgi:hypothetical protein